MRATAARLVHSAGSRCQVDLHPPRESSSLHWYTARAFEERGTSCPTALPGLHAQLSCRVAAQWNTMLWPACTTTVSPQRTEAQHARVFGVGAVVRGVEGALRKAGLQAPAVHLVHHDGPAALTEVRLQAYSDTAFRGRDCCSYRRCYNVRAHRRAHHSGVSGAAQARLCSRRYWPGCVCYSSAGMQQGNRATWRAAGGALTRPTCVTARPAMWPIWRHRTEASTSSQELHVGRRGMCVKVRFK